MSDLIKFLTEATAIPGLPGFEKPEADLVAKWFGKYSADVWQDPFCNTFARMGGPGPQGAGGSPQRRPGPHGALH